MSILKSHIFREIKKFNYESDKTSDIRCSRCCSSALILGLLNFLFFFKLSVFLRCISSCRTHSHNSLLFLCREVCATFKSSIKVCPTIIDSLTGTSIAKIEKSVINLSLYRLN